MKCIGGETQKVNTVLSSDDIIHFDQNSLTYFALFVYTVIIHFAYLSYILSITLFA